MGGSEERRRFAAGSSSSDSDLLLVDIDKNRASNFENLASCRGYIVCHFIFYLLGGVRFILEYVRVGEEREREN